MTSKDITVNGIDITVHSDGSVTKPYHSKTVRTFGTNANGYKLTKVGGKSFQIHRLIAKAFLPDFLDLPQVDHIDGDRSNNDSSNLRMATNLRNGQGFNEKRTGCSSQYRGVSWDKRKEKWVANCTIDYNSKHIGYFTTEVDAALARDAYVFSQGFPKEGLNFPDCFIGLQRQQ